MSLRSIRWVLAVAVVILWSFLFLRFRDSRNAGGGGAPRAAAAEAASPEPEDPAYALDSVFRPEVDRAGQATVPAGILFPKTVFFAADPQPFSYFGQAVALDGDVAVVGAPYDDTGGTDAGAAYVFRRQGVAWRQEAKLTAPAPVDLDRFGFSVAVQGRTVAVGADRRDRASQDDCGAAYVYEFDGREWRLAASLQPGGLEAKAGFGVSVAVDGRTLLVGAPGSRGGTVPEAGAVYGFERRPGGWAQRFVLTAPEPSQYAAFGHAVALQGGTAAVGAPMEGDLAGAAYLFRQESGTWGFEERLASEAPLAKFGAAVSLRGGLALVGAPRAGVGESTRAGAAFLYDRSSGAWRRIARLTAPSPRSDEEFGRSVSLSEDLALVGSNFGDALGLNTGIAYLFARRGGAWAVQGPVLPEDAAAIDEFGTSVAVSQGRALIGAPRKATRGNAAGAAYVYGGP